MDKIKREIEKKIKGYYTIKADSLNKEFKALDNECLAIVDNITQQAIDCIIGTIKDTRIIIDTETLNHATKRASRKTLYMFKASKWIQEADENTWHKIADACCIYGKRRVWSVKRKFINNPSYKYYTVTELDKKRLKKIGLDLF